MDEAQLSGDGPWEPWVAVSTLSRASGCLRDETGRPYEELGDHADFIKGKSGVGRVVGMDADFFDKLPKSFFSRFKAIFEKHVSEHWRSDPILPYLLGGHPVLAKEFARYLRSYHLVLESIDRDLDDDGAAEDDDDDNDVEAFEFPDEDVVLDHHQGSHGPVTVNVRSAMESLTSKACRAQIMDDPLVKDNFALILKLAEASTPVELLDKETWGDVDFGPLYDDFVALVLLALSDNQRCENYVQLAGLIATTNVGELRRSLRAQIHSHIMRPFNQESVELLRSAVDDENEKRKIKRVEGTKRIELFGRCITEFGREADEAKRKMGTDAYKQLKTHLGDKTKKMSNTEHENHVSNFRASLDKPRSFVNAERNGRVDVSATMGGAVMLSFLTKKRGMEDHIAAECKARKIRSYKSLSIGERKKALRKDEFKRRVGDGEQELKESEVRAIVPQSDKLKEALEMQERFRAVQEDTAAANDENVEP